MSTKVLSLESLIQRRQEARRAGRRVVQCHGCFDIVHPGHIRHLRDARTHGDILLVTITGDAGIGKGSGRPLIPQELRAENLAAFDFVDWVAIDHSPTARDLLTKVQPDVYVKGREYELNADPRFAAERDAVEAGGGRVVFSSGDVVFSSSALIATLEEEVDPYHSRLVQLRRDARLQNPQLGAVLTACQGKRIAVVGETIIDTYILCDQPDIAGEAPVMTLRPVETRRYDGGSAIIARHLAALGARPTLVTALPDDDDGRELRARLEADGIDVHAIDATARVSEKRRFLVGGQKVMKLDMVEPVRLDARQQERLVSIADEAAQGHDGAIVADFGLGLLSPGVVTQLCRSLRQRVNILTGDVSGRRASLRRLQGMDFVTPREAELRDAYGMHDESLPTVAWQFLQETASNAALVTLGSEGLLAFDRLPDAEEAPTDWRTRVSSEHIPSLCGHAVDPLGCGDALLAGATLAMCAGASLLPAAFIGAVAAAAEARRLGNIPVTMADVRRGAMRLGETRLTFDAGVGIMQVPANGAQTLAS